MVLLFSTADSCTLWDHPIRKLCCKSYRFLVSIVRVLGVQKFRPQGPFTLGVCTCICDWFFWFLPLLNVNSAIEMHTTHSVADTNAGTIANADTQCEWALRFSSSWILAVINYKVKHTILQWFIQYLMLGLMQDLTFLCQRKKWIKGADWHGAMVTLSLNIRQVASLFPSLAM